MKTIYLLGNPNVGKTTLFNLLTGQKAQTANYAGTTLWEKKGKVKTPNGEEYTIIDLPGMHSFDSQREEEKVAWKKMEEAMLQKDALFVQVSGTSQWKHSLAITLELQQKGIHPIVFFNVKKNEVCFSAEFCIRLKGELGIDILFGNAEEKSFLDTFWKEISAQEDRRKSPVARNTNRPKHTCKEAVDILQKISCPNEQQKKTGKWSIFFDRIFLHSLLGTGIFFLFMWIVFQLTFTIGTYPMNWIDAGTVALQDILRPLLGNGFFGSLVVDGLITGVGGTVIFLPNLIILFFFLSLMQESGYLSRSSYLFNTFFKKVGIPGKASIHLLMGFGCNVPSVMAVRAMENKKEKVITSMMTLFMSCGARLPVYTLLISAFIPAGYQGATLFAIYTLGILMAFATGYVMNKMNTNLGRTRLLMEMPELTLPSFPKIMRFIIHKCKMFLFRVGKFIVPASMALWFLFSYPAVAVEQEGIGSSYGASLSRTIEPVFSPLGFDWRITAGIFSGLAAKEVMVTAFAELYDTPADEAELGTAMQQSGIFSLPVALSLLVFTLLYTPCIAVLGAIKEELGTKWMVFAIWYPITLAWICAFLTYHISLFFL